MHVVATAGHVDHGKSTLVRALTGMDPDRLAEERRRGLTIDLGFAWTAVGATELVFVDVPGHERFLTNMLAGVGPAPAALLVIAANEGWQPQTEEHVRALRAFGVARLDCAVTKADLADPRPAIAEARRRLASHGYRDVAPITVSATSAVGLDVLRSTLLTRAGAAPARPGPVRLWIDRVFTIRGAGTVVTGTLGSGRIAVDDVLELSPTGLRVSVRAVEALGRPRPEIDAISRVAVNLRGVDRTTPRRGMALVAPGSHPAQVDVAVAVDAGRLPRQLTVHAGSAAVAAVVRRRAGDALGVRLATPLPLVAEDRLVLREPASRRLWSATVESVPPTAGEASTPAAAADDRHVVRLAGGARLDRAAIPAVVDTLRGLAQPFTVSAARQALGGTRREVLPLLEHLDASQRTVRLPDGTRRVVR